MDQSSRSYVRSMLFDDVMPHLLQILRFNGDFILSHSFETTITNQRLGNAVFYLTLFSCMQQLYHKVIFKINITS